MDVEILKEVNCPKNVINHSKAVCKKAIKIASNFDDIDISLVEQGSLLHDIGRSKTHGIKHAVIGARIAHELGYPDEICRIIERHIGCGITKNEAKELGLPEKSYVPQTLEEKIVAHSDNLLSGSEEVNIGFVIKKWTKRMDHPDENIHRLILLNNELIKPFRKR